MRPSLAVALLVAGIASCQWSATVRAFPQDATSAAPAPDASAQSSDAQAAPPPYDKSIFQKPVPRDELTFLSSFDGTPTGDVIRDKQFRKLLKTVLPGCMFHYGSDMPLSDALDEVLTNSSEPAQIRDGSIPGDRRYVTISGHSGPYLQGRGFMWFDLQDGIALGAFYFHPTNGEPTPTVAVFSKQVKEKYLEMSQLPPAFAEDLAKWTAHSNIPAVTTRYFLTGSNERIVLEHTEDYCSPAEDGMGDPDESCQQMNADAADIDMDAAIYVNQTNHATNATAWMITDDDQRAWIELRLNTCDRAVDALGCHIRMTHDRTHVLLGHGGEPHPGPGRR